ncbi:MAG: hypothetical protein IJD68_07570 [Ruminococcus sp.]|nr:hypothetical protein [Ruminococcus sp.]MBQ4129613.1 hypothetical protein [Ruminococcus sp.]
MKVQYIGTGTIKAEDGRLFYCDYDGLGNVISDTGEVYEITKRDTNDNPIEIQITEISKLIKGFYYDLNLFRTTNKDIYSTCAKHTLKKILDKGYTDIYLTLSKVL